MKVNGATFEPGCYIDGHWGQYATDRLAEIAERIGWAPDTWMQDPRKIRRRAELYEISDETEQDLWELFHACDDEIIEWLNDHTEDGVWGWQDGELFLQTEEEWQHAL